MQLTALDDGDCVKVTLPVNPAMLETVILFCCCEPSVIPREYGFEVMLKSAIQI